MGEHSTIGCACVTCTKWRQDIYDRGRWPRPRTYNGEIFRRLLGQTPHIPEGRATFDALVPNRYKQPKDEE